MPVEQIARCTAQTRTISSTMYPITAYYDNANGYFATSSVTLALNAARTAFNLPCGKETQTATSRFRWLSWRTESFLRRDRSSSATETNLSSASSSRCRIAASRSLGKTCRDGSAVSISLLPAGKEGPGDDDEEGFRPNDEYTSPEDRFGALIISSCCLLP
jgi:hypothetical protein